jgi:hypothetical protein
MDSSNHIATNALRESKRCGRWDSMASQPLGVTRQWISSYVPERRKVKTKSRNLTAAEAPGCHFGSYRVCGRTRWGSSAVWPGCGWLPSAHPPGLLPRSNQHRAPTRQTQTQVIGRRLNERRTSPVSHAFSAPFILHSDRLPLPAWQPRPPPKTGRAVSSRAAARSSWGSALIVTAASAAPRASVACTAASA